MAGMGTGYPNWFACRKARSIYYGDRSSRGDEVLRTSRGRAAHVTSLTGRRRPTRSSKNKGHPRKSKWDFEYTCICGHIGWSCHIDLESGWERSLGIPSVD